MKKNVKVNAFIGEKDSIWALYYKLMIKERLDVEILSKGKIAEIKVASKDYVHAIAIATELVSKKQLENIAWVSPCGAIMTNNKGSMVKIHDNEEKKVVPVFTGASAIESNNVSAYLNAAGINSMNSIGDMGMWQVFVNSSDYFEAVNIGAKFVDGHDYRNFFWNAPTGQIMFNVKDVAKKARTELDEVLEA